MQKPVLQIFIMKMLVFHFKSFVHLTYDRWDFIYT